MNRRKGIINALRLCRITSSKEWRELRDVSSLKDSKEFQERRLKNSCCTQPNTFKPH
jgi:hypothetical protein